MGIIKSTWLDANLYLCVSFLPSPKVVKERMVCHAIIGKSSGKEKIMKTEINIEFISPLLEFSTKQVMFRVDKVSQ